MKKKFRFVEKPRTLENFKGQEIELKNVQGGCWGFIFCIFSFCPALQFYMDPYDPLEQQWA